MRKTKPLTRQEVKASLRETAELHTFWQTGMKEAFQKSGSQNQQTHYTRAYDSPSMDVI